MDQSSPLSALSIPVRRAIENASRRTGVDFDYLLDQARIESGFRTAARAATSSATGLYQFTTQTWLASLKRHGTAHGYGWAADAIEPAGRGTYKVADAGLRGAILGLRSDPDAAAVMAGELASDNRAYLADTLGRTPEPVDLYLAHFLGAAGAGKFLTAWRADADQPAAPLFAKAAAANRSVFFNANGGARSLDEIRRSFAKKIDGHGVPTLRPEGIVGHRLIASTAAHYVPLELRPIEPMPKGLSLDFARDAYRKLAAIRGKSS